MPDWSIKIVPGPDGKPAAFMPDVIGGQAGGTLVTQVDDIVTWNNETSEDVWPWPTDANGKPLPNDQVSTAFGNYLCNKIPAGGSSTPYFNTIAALAGKTLTYCCKSQPSVTGAIKINPLPPLNTTATS